VDANESLGLALGGCATFVPIVVIATVVVEAVPHVRGIAFAPEIR
jgi:hypothetical protein